jgi:deazaflavin-dependent oxidoreductase (nitroreductase family)
MATTYAQSNPIHRFVRWSAATRPVAWLYARTLHHIDRLVFRLTRGRITFAAIVSGLPVVMLTTTGARSGRRSTLPVLGVPDDDRVVVIASNYGQRHNPAWYYNLRANPDASLVVGGVEHSVVAQEARGDERDRLWRKSLTIYPGWTSYRERASRRQIPIMVLAPRTGSYLEARSR